jgi:nicotinamide riboside kinase
MKVYFIGSHSCGKSTLARYVSQQYNLPMISETARMILSEQELQIDTLRYDLNAIDTYQKDVFNRQLVEEQKHISFVSDRSALDILAYSAQHSRVLSQLIDSPDLQEYIKKLQGQFIFFVRPSKATLKADGVRESINWEGIVEIDAMIKLLLQIFKLRFFPINTDNMQERVRLIDSVLAFKK